MPLRIGYVREHFLSPLLQFAEDDQNKTFVLVECPSGTGQIISRLEKDEIDVAIALTDALISGIAKGSEAYRLVGSYVTTPLNWAVITGKEAKYNSIADLKDTILGISRYGSGSQTMAFVMALQQGWPTKDLKFQVNNDINGLIASVKDGSTSAFMWEWYTTKPWIDRGEARFIGSVPTPWPSWMIAAHPTRAPAKELKAFIDGLSGYVRSFDSVKNRAGRNIAYMHEKFGYSKSDIEDWMKTVGYTSNCASINFDVISKTLGILQEAGFIAAPPGGFDVQKFVSLT